MRLHFTKAFFAALLAMMLVVANFVVLSDRAQAISVNASSATFNFDFASGGNGVLLSGGTASSTGSVIKFTNVTGNTTSVSIDAIVTTTLANTTITNFDNVGNASSNRPFFQVNGDIDSDQGTIAYKFDFYEAGTYTGPGTGTPIVLNNVSITSIDLDGAGSGCQFTDFTGFQSYFLSSGSAVSVRTNATDSNVPVGVTRFQATSCGSNSNRVQDAVEVRFDSVSSFTTKFGATFAASPNYFGIGFQPLSTMFSVTQPSAVANPANQPPTSTSTTRYVTIGQASILQLADFGVYSDPDSNPFMKAKITTLPSSGSLEKFVNGSWVSVLLNDEILVSEITNGNLRFTGSSDNSLQFKVSDGGTSYSSSAYTMSLLVATTAQTITFPNPGTKLPSDPTFASTAAATSGLTVTLTSLTIGVCTVSGTDITPVAAGTCTIVASQGGSSSFSAATSVTQTFPISTLTPQTISAPRPGSQTYSGSSSTITLAPTASSNLAVTMISLSPSVCTVSGFVVTILGPGNCSIRNTQSGDSSTAAAPPVEFTFNVSSSVNNFTLTYNSNNADSGSVPTPQTGSGNISISGNSGSLVRAGYTFGGWNIGGQTYNASDSFSLSANTNATAIWTAVSQVNNYTLTYNSNNADSGSVPTAQTGSGNISISGNSGSLVRAGYTFGGWNISGQTYNASDSFSLSANTNATAIWTPVVAAAPNVNSASTLPHTGLNAIQVTMWGSTFLLLGFLMLFIRKYGTK